MNRARYLPAAVSDLDEITDYIFARNFDAAIQFCNAVELDAKLVAEFPGIGTRRHFTVSPNAEFRSWPIKGFRDYLIFYTPAEHGVDIVRIVHGARNLHALFRT